MNKTYIYLAAAAALAFYLYKKKSAPKVTEQQAMIKEQNSF